MTRRVVLLESWAGRYADSPRSISERLAVVRPDLRLVWVVENDRVELPPGVERVRRYSPAHFARLATADFLVCNDMQPRYLRKSGRTTYVQTWHGTPLKRIGFDVEHAHYEKDAVYLRRLARDVRKWDYLLSPSPYCTEMLRQAFRYDGEVLETGYPRNDLLSSPAASDIRARLRRQLSLRDDDRVVLYAPTWRDDSWDAHGRPTVPVTLDLEQFARAFGDRTVVLVRMHRLVGQRLPVAGAHVRDVSDLPDIQELYLAADVLVTDYSSTMFDFAVTGRPILFFVPDLASYRDEVRGFYFDLVAEAPGPLCESTEEVVKALVDLDSVTTAYRDAYARFQARFCPLEDGHATDRVVQAVFPF